MSATETTPARVPRRGKMSGSITEWCVFWTLKPGVSGQKIVDRYLGGPFEATGRDKAVI